MPEPLDQKQISDIAGWEAVKKARALLAAGCVLKAEASDSKDGNAWIARGVVLQGRKKFACGAKVRSVSDADNLCSCPSARRDGRFCEHTAAVLMQLLKDPEKRSESGQVSQHQSAVENLKTFAWLPQLSWESDGGATGGRQAMSLQSPPEGYSCSDAFRERIVSWLAGAGLAPARDPQAASLDTAQWLGLLEAARGGELPLRFSAAEKASGGRELLVVVDTPTRIPLTITQDESDQNLAKLERPSLQSSEFVTDGARLWILRRRDRLALRTAYGDLPAKVRRLIDPLLRNSGSGVSSELPVAELKAALDHLHCMFHMECSDDLIGRLRVLQGEPKFSLKVEGSLNHLDVRMVFQYGAGEASSPAAEAAALARIGGGVWEVTEDAGRKQTGGEGLRRTAMGAIKGENAILEYYASTVDPLIRSGEWEIELGERFARVIREIEIVRPRIDAQQTDAGWLDFELSFQSDGGEALSEAEVRRLMESGQSRTRSVAGKRIAVSRANLDDLFENLAELDTQQLADGSGLRRSDGAQAFYIERIADDFTGGDLGVKCPSEPVGLKAELRTYQGEGLRWLASRMSRGVGAILADEMGLGKTVQTLALIATLNPKGKGGGRLAPVLIVCPTSLIGSWKREAEAFLPSHHVLVLHGPNRSRYFEVLGAADIVLTSFGSLVRDLEHYGDVQFRLAVIDEASFLKNPRTKTTKAAWAIPAQSRLALTGTPVENSLQDLWSIMEFANPGYFGGREDFMIRYGKAGDAASARRLRARLEPFLLRRTKREVATDLPDKLERILYCELSAKQRAAYEQLLREGRESFKNIQKANSWNESRMQVLTLLLRLRQVCCDLRILSDKSPREGASGKLEALDTLLTEALAGGHRVLIFSQFVSMLSLLRSQLEREGIDYAYIDGSTTADARAEEVRSFQENDSPPVFLISLKAGGYGLTLTAADTVIHFDPWWNPAVEAQATDRAHRIGQSNPVTAYKLIATGTVEERILQLQQKKRDLIDAALDEERPLMSSLTMEDIEFVLS